MKARRCMSHPKFRRRHTGAKTSVLIGLKPAWSAFAWARPMSQLGPGCVKTCTSRECAELFSLFSSFDGDCQSGSFVIRRSRDKLSTRKFDVGVFTQAGPKADIRIG